MREGHQKNAFSIIVFRIAERFRSILSVDKVLLTSYGIFKDLSASSFSLPKFNPGWNFWFPYVDTDISDRLTAYVYS